MSTSTTVGGASATCGDDKQYDGAVEGRDRIADMGPRRAWALDSNMVRGASSVRPRGHALSNAHAARARVARAASPAVAAAAVADDP